MIAYVCALIPLVNVYLFLCAPLMAKFSRDKPMRITMLLKNKVFWLCVLTIMFGGATDAKKVHSRLS